MKKKKRRVTRDKRPVTYLSRPQQKEATRATVIEAARKVFTVWGYKGGSMRRIAKEAGASTGALYISFDTKADLWIEAMNCAPPDPMELVKMVANLASPRIIESVEDACETLESLRIWARQIVVGVEGAG